MKKNRRTTKMKKTILSLGCLLLMTGLSFGANELLSLTHSGINSITLSSGTTSFQLDVSSSWTGYSSVGLSYWLQVPTTVASDFSITAVTYGSTWSSPNATGPSTVLFNDSVSADGAAANFSLETRDLGATVGVGNPSTAAGSYQEASMTINLSGLGPGTYTLKSTSQPSRISEQSGDNPNPPDNPFPVATFTITIVPEPATLSLLGLSGLGTLGLTMLRARRKG
jgi:hypothetical protein